jgi:hypothetical protein
MLHTLLPSTHRRLHLIFCGAPGVLSGLLEQMDYRLRQAIEALNDLIKSTNERFVLCNHPVLLPESTCYPSPEQPITCRVAITCP